jgi:hypothetical protein
VSRSYDYGGLATDGYLTFSGDEDNPAFIGDGPFHQAIGGTFDLNSSQTRFPCSLTVSFWRTVAPIDATTNLALTANTVTFTCVTGKFEISPGGVVLNPGESYTFSGGIPQVALLSGDPRSAAGTFGGFARCDNTQVAVQARIDWSSKERMHVLYGIVRECYEEGTPCATACDGDPSPDVLYVTISNAVFPSGTYPAAFPNGTYVLDRYPNFCTIYLLLLDKECDIVPGSFTNHIQINGNFSTNLGVLDLLQDVSKDGVCGIFTFETLNQDLEQPCGPGVVASGSATWYWVALIGGSVTTISGTLDWEVSA